MSLQPDKNNAAALKQTHHDHEREARGWERVLPVFIRRTPDGVHVQIYWRRLSLTLAVMFVAAWLLLPFAAWIYVHHHRGVKAVTYAHLALPWRWDDYRRVRAAHYVATAKELLTTAQWRAAYFNLRVGLQKDPAHREGRLLLAQFETRRRRYELAEQTLVEGLAYHRGDAVYLQSVFQFFLQLQYDDRAIALGTEILADPATGPAQKRIAAQYAASAHAYRGSYDKAEDMLLAHQIIETRDGRLLDALIESERGYPELAVVKLEQLHAGMPADDEVAARLADELRALGRMDEARRLNLLRQLARPSAPQPRIALLRIYAESGDEQRASREVEDVFRDFANDADALLSLGEYAANKGDTALARRIYEHSKASGLAWDGPALMTVESAIVARRYQEALDLTRTLLRENPDWSRRYYALFNGLQAIALHGLGDREAARLFLKNFLGQANLRSEQLASISLRLAAVGAADEARDVLARAVRDDPLNQAALTHLIELDLAAGRIEEVPADVRKLLTMRRPPPALLKNVYRELGRDRWLFLAGRTAALAGMEEALAAKPASRGK